MLERAERGDLKVLLRSFPSGGGGVSLSLSFSLSLSLFFSLFRKGAARPRRGTRGFTSRHFSFTATRQVPEIRSLVDALFLFRSYLM